MRRYVAFAAAIAAAGLFWASASDAQIYSKRFASTTVMDTADTTYEIASMEVSLKRAGYLSISATGRGQFLNGTYADFWLQVDDDPNGDDRYFSVVVNGLQIAHSESPQPSFDFAFGISLQLTKKLSKGTHTIYFKGYHRLGDEVTVIPHSITAIYSATGAIEE